MIITLSAADRFFDKRVEQAARDAGCFGQVRWATSFEVRFVLLDKPAGRVASFAQHDDVIARLFMQDPKAKIRTAKATYDGAAEFYAQKIGRQPTTSKTS